MRLERLRLNNMRRFDALDFEPGPGLNLITGNNGAGKTTILEAAHLMAYGRSFRGRVRDGLIRSGSADLDVFIEWTEASAGALDGMRTRRAGLRHSGADWEGRLDGESVGQIAELCAAFAVITFEPGSHALITAGAESRRRYLDWGLFHVEPAFLRHWQRYSRALKQRNAVLKRSGDARQLAAWDSELAQSGELLTESRNIYLAALAPLVRAMAAELAPQLGDVEMEYLPGWRRADMSLGDALMLMRDRDLASGHTSVGPHRADWRLGYGRLPGREALSRGQAKLAALSALFAQAQHFAGCAGEWPVFALDDLASELDRDHQGRVLDRLATTGAQVLLTGTEMPAAFQTIPRECEVFHVEHGQLTRR